MDVHGRSRLLLEFTRQTPRLRGRLRRAGWTDDTRIVVADPSTSVATVLDHLDEVTAAGHPRIMLAVPDTGDLDGWTLTLLTAPTTEGAPS